MSLAFESLDQFFSDFATDCVKPDSSIVKVILDIPDQDLLANMVVSSDVKITGKSSDLGDLSEQDRVTIDAEQFVVRKISRIDDGRVCEVFMTRAL